MSYELFFLIKIVSCVGFFLICMFLAVIAD
jgi:hypothetical protein